MECINYKMKIGVLTFHRSINYGAYIQCYSLSKKIQKDFPNSCVEVIDYDMPKMAKYYSFTLFNYLTTSNNLVDFIKRLGKLCIEPLTLQRERKKKRIFLKALSHLPLSNKTINSNSITPLIDYINNNYDIVICGSDAIWNYNVRGWPNPYFLSLNVTSKKYSYAASCYGMLFERISKTKLTEIRDIFNSYSYIGVRDDETNCFFNSLSCNLHSFHNCDPSLLLDFNQMPLNLDSLNKKMKSKGFIFGKKSVCVMGDNALFKFVKRIMGPNYQYVCVYNYCRDADVNLIDLDPFEWAYAFRFFTIVFTTYFHGTLLSLKNLTPTICLALNNEYNKKHVSKVEDVLTRLGLIDLYFEVNNDIDAEQRLQNKVCELLGDLNSYKKRVLEGISMETESYLSFEKELAGFINGK